jgi:hypothetical protein
MRLLTAISLATLLGATAGPGLSAQSAMPADSLAHARKLTEWFFTARHDSVLPHFAVDDGDQQVTTAELQERLEGLTARAGLETEVVEEKFVKRNGNTQYWRTSKYTIFEEPVLFRWAFNKQGQIIGMGVGPASDAPPIDPD